MKAKQLCAVAICLHWLVASGCYTWKTVSEPNAIRRELSRTVRVTGPTGERVTMVYGTATAPGVQFRSGQLVPWDSIARLEERRFSVIRTAGAVVGGWILVTATMGFFISGPEAIGLSRD